MLSPSDDVHPNLELARTERRAAMQTSAARQVSLEIAARQASLEIAAREAALETQMDADWIAAREASLVEARRRAERGPSYQKELSKR